MDPRPILSIEAAAGPNREVSAANRHCRLFFHKPLRLNI